MAQPGLSPCEGLFCLYDAKVKNCATYKLWCKSLVTTIICSTFALSNENNEIWTKRKNWWRSHPKNGNSSKELEITTALIRMVIHNSFGTFRNSSTKWFASHTNKGKASPFFRKRLHKSKTYKLRNNGNSDEKPGNSYRYEKKSTGYFNVGLMAWIRQYIFSEIFILVLSQDGRHRWKRRNRRIQPAGSRANAQCAYGSLKSYSPCSRKYLGEVLIDLQDKSRPSPTVATRPLAMRGALLYDEKVKNNASRINCYVKVWCFSYIFIYLQR